MNHFNGMADAHDLLQQMLCGQTDSYTVVSEHLQRCKQAQSRLNATTEILWEKASERAKAPIAGPLSGVPITLKETIAVKGHEITAGSMRMKPLACDRNAVVVDRLEQAGAIVIARSTVPEFVMAAETCSLRWGVTNNPLDITRTCGGSTGGEAALIASGCSPIGIGTDILGSIRSPASFCGIVGFRPASQMVNKQGVWSSGVGFFETWNGVGPMARSVRDIRLAYNVIADTPAAKPQGIDHLRLLSPVDFDVTITSPSIHKALAQATSNLKNAGMQGDTLSFADLADWHRMKALVTGESTAAWKDWLSSGADGDFHVAKEAFLQLIGKPSIAPALFTWFVMEYLHRSSTAAYAETVSGYEQARKKYHEKLGSDGILILPTLGMLAPKHNRMNMVKFIPGVSKTIAPLTLINALNLSAIAIPAHRFSDSKTGMIPSVMLACAPGNEGALLDVASVVESHLVAAPYATNDL